jgi:hypothetical protein
MSDTLPGTGSPTQGGMREAPGEPSIWYRSRWSGPAWNHRHCARHLNTYLNPVATVAGCGPKNAEEAMMRRLILAGAVLALAAGVTAGAMASDQKADKSGGHVGRSHSAAFGRTHHVRPSSRVAGVRGPESWYPGGGSPGYHGGFIDLGPLGITAACGSYPHRYGYCGSGYGTPINAWSY